MLVDDDASTNRFHQIVLESLQITSNIIFAKNGKNALDYLMQTGEYKNSTEAFMLPNLIMIDLNMPVMDGFRFIELYTKTEQYIINKPKIIVLSTSLIPEEKEKIEADDNIYMFLNKPLTKDVITKLIEGFKS